MYYINIYHMSGLEEKIIAGFDNELNEFIYNY